MLAKILEGTLSLVLLIAGALHCTTVSDTPTGGDDPTTPTDPTAYPTVDADCGSTKASLKKYLLDAGYDQNAVAGIMGNLMKESGNNISIYAIDDSSVKPITTSFVAYDLSKKGDAGKNFSGGFGIAQWDYWSRVKNLQLYANQYAGGKVVSETAQFGYLVKELSTNLGPSALNGRSMEDIAWVIRRSYENPYSVRCTKNSPCKSYSFTCESGYPCRYTGNVKNGKKEIAYWNSVNTHDAKTPYSDIVNNKLDYWAAWLTLEETIKDAASIKALSIVNCYGSDYSDPDTSGDRPTSEDEEPYVPTGSQDPEDQPTSYGTGALGASSSNGFYRQDNYKSTIWRKDGETINDSGCSLIAVANAMKVLNVPNSDPKTLAGYTKNVIKDKNDTGWGSNSMSIDYLLKKTGLTGHYAWTSYSTSTSSKIQSIREALASGKAIIAGGDRKHVTGVETCPSTSTGDCVFSYNGHFVTIVGITANDELVVANPAKGNGKGNVYNAATVLKYSNKAMIVSK